MCANTYPGDSIIPDAAMIYDNRSRLIHAPPSAVWPWVLQIGKGRGGWYLPSFFERFLPRRWRATREIKNEWQTLAVGDRIPDYGFNAIEDVFDVAILEEQKSIVFTSDRYGTSFTWAILLETTDAGDGASGVVVHLRFRGRIQRSGWQRKVLVVGGHWMDWITTAPMLAGLAERAEMAWLETKKTT